MEPEIERVKNENVQLRRIMLRVASALHETEGVSGSAASTIILMILDGYKDIEKEQSELIAHSINSYQAMKEALEAIEVEYREMMGVSLTENYSHKRDKRHKEQYRKVSEALTLAKGKDKEP